MRDQISEPQRKKPVRRSREKEGEGAYGAGGGCPEFERGGLGYGRHSLMKRKHTQVFVLRENSNLALYSEGRGLCSYWVSSLGLWKVLSSGLCV